METNVEETVGGGEVGCWWGAGGRRTGWAWDGGATSSCGETAATAAASGSAAGNVFEFSAGADSVGAAVSAATGSVSGASGK